MTPTDDEDAVPPTEHFDDELPEGGNGEFAEHGASGAGGDEDAPIISLDSSSDERRALSWDRPPPVSSEDRRELEYAYDCLGIRTPLEELATFARGRVEALVRAGEAERAELTRAAEALGVTALRHVMSSPSKEGGQ